MEHKNSSANRIQDLKRLPEHPTGTLAVMLIYAALFVFGWVFLYLFVFLERGTPGP